MLLWSPPPCPLQRSWPCRRAGHGACFPPAAASTAAAAAAATGFVAATTAVAVYDMLALLPAGHPPQFLTLMMWTFFGEFGKARVRGQLWRDHTQEHHELCKWASGQPCTAAGRQQGRAAALITNHVASPAPLPPLAGINNVQITPTLQIANAFTSFVFGIMDLFNGCACCGRRHLFRAGSCAAPAGLVCLGHPSRCWRPCLDSLGCSRVVQVLQAQVPDSKWMDMALLGKSDLVHTLRPDCRRAGQRGNCDAGGYCARRVYAHVSAFV